MTQPRIPATMDMRSGASVAFIPIAGGTSTSERNGEDSPLVDLHRHLLEARGSDEFVHFGLRATAHDPALPLAIDQHAGDEFLLRMPGLIRVDQITSRFNSIGKSTKR